MSKEYLILTKMMWFCIGFTVALIIIAIVFNYGF